MYAERLEATAPSTALSSISVENKDTKLKFLERARAGIAPLVDARWLTFGNFIRFIETKSLIWLETC